MLLLDKKLVVIGGTSGMGWSAVRAFLREGASVVAVGLEPTNPVDIPVSQDNLRVAYADARAEHTASDAVQQCRDLFGAFDGLYHVAGGSGRKMGDGPLHEMSLDGWNYTLELNLTSMMLSNRAAVRALLDQNRPGSILNMGSVLGFSPAPAFFGTHAYAAAKSAVTGFSKALAAYYAPQDIRVNVLAPALVETPMSKRAVGDAAIQAYIGKKQPLDGGRTGRPGDLDGLAVYFMSDQSRFTTGQVVCVDGGWSVTG